jgi:hypothetical protein
MHMQASANPVCIINMLEYSLSVWNRKPSTSDCGISEERTKWEGEEGNGGLGKFCINK